MRRKRNEKALSRILALAESKKTDELERRCFVFREKNERRVGKDPELAQSVATTARRLMEKGYTGPAFDFMIYLRTYARPVLSNEAEKDFCISALMYRQETMSWNQMRVLLFMGHDFNDIFPTWVDCAIEKTPTFVSQAHALGGDALNAFILSLFHDVSSFVSSKGKEKFALAALQGIKQLLQEKKIDEADAAWTVVERLGHQFESKEAKLEAAKLVAPLFPAVQASAQESSVKESLFKDFFCRIGFDLPEKEPLAAELSKEGLRLVSRYAETSERMKAASEMFNAFVKGTGLDSSLFAGLMWRGAQDGLRFPFAVLHAGGAPQNPLQIMTWLPSRLSYSIAQLDAALLSRQFKPGEGVQLPLSVTAFRKAAQEAASPSLEEAVRLRLARVRATEPKAALG